MSAAQYFSTSYQQARVKFLEAAAIRGLYPEPYNHPLPGKDGEQLAVDVALQGSPTAKKLLVVSSACHGVEGYCGSGAQVAALSSDAWMQEVNQGEVAVLYIHALNPFGFSHIRRVTNENVDLNRNFQNFSAPLPVNEHYANLHDLLLPEQWPPNEANQTAVDQWIAEHGMLAFQAAVTGGQYKYPNGVFFGGQAPTWSNTTLRSILKKYGQRCSQMGWIDIHTGLGPSGHGEKICATPNDPVQIARTRAWWGPEATNIYDGTSSSAELTGMMFQGVMQECSQAQYTGIALEFGTVPVMGVLQSLRAEHWLHNNPQAPAHLRASIKEQLMAAFYVQTDVWKEQIVSQTFSAMRQGLAGLSTTA